MICLYKRKHSFLRQKTVFSKGESTVFGLRKTAQLSTIYHLSTTTPQTRINNGVWKVGGRVVDNSAKYFFEEVCLLFCNDIADDESTLNIAFNEVEGSRLGIKRLESEGKIAIVNVAAIF